MSRLGDAKQKKGPAAGRAFRSSRFTFALAGDHVRRAGTLSTLTDGELDLLVFVKCCVAFGSDFRVVNEEVFAAVIRSNEAKSLARVEPFYCACRHVLVS